MPESEQGRLDTTKLLSALADSAGYMADQSRFTEGVKHLLALIGAATGGSRVWVFQLIELSDDAIVQDYVFEWNATSHYQQSNQRRFRFFSTLFDDPHYQQLIDQRLKGQGQSMVTHELTPGSLRTNLESQGILSMATVPIRFNGKWWGTLGIDDCQRALRWEGSGLQVLTIAAELIASGLYRQQLNSRSLQLELLHRVTDCGVWEIDLVCGELYCSQGLRRILNYPATYPHIPLRRLLSCVVAEDRPLLFQRLREALQAKASDWRQDARVRVAGGALRWSEIVAEISYDAKGRPLNIAGLLIDISHRKHQEQQALTASNHDALTELLNRRGLEQHFENLAQRPSTKKGDKRWPYLLLMDIDHFKRVNDQHGHPAGDALLCLMARRIQQVLRQQDSFARIGGEEFAVLIDQVTPDQASELGERIRHVIDQHPFCLTIPDSHQKIELHVTLSLGLVALPDSDAPYDCQAIAIARADRALYAAKHHGRNRMVVYDSASSIA